MGRHRIPQGSKPAIRSATRSILESIRDTQPVISGKCPTAAMQLYFFYDAATGNRPSAHCPPTQPVGDLPGRFKTPRSMRHIRLLYRLCNLAKRHHGRAQNSQQSCADCIVVRHFETAEDPLRRYLGTAFSRIIVTTSKSCYRCDVSFNSGIPRGQCRRGQ